MKSKYKGFINTKPTIILLLITLALVLIASGCSYELKSKISSTPNTSTFNGNSETIKRIKANAINSSSEQSVELINVIENNGDPIQLVINVGSLDSPTYVKLGQITEVKNMEVRLFIYLKNKDLLSYIDSRNLNKPLMVITTKPSNSQIMTKNPLADQNSYNCSVDMQTSPDKSVDISIEKIYDKSAKQILVKPITFKLKLINENK